MCYGIFRPCFRCLFSNKLTYIFVIGVSSTVFFHGVCHHVTSEDVISELLVLVAQKMTFLFIPCFKVMHDLIRKHKTGWLLRLIIITKEWHSCFEDALIKKWTKTEHVREKIQIIHQTPGWTRKRNAMQVTSVLVRNDNWQTGTRGTIKTWNGENECNEFSKYDPISTRLCVYLKRGSGYRVVYQNKINGDVCIFMVFAWCSLRVFSKSFLHSLYICSSYYCM